MIDVAPEMHGMMANDWVMSEIEQRAKRRRPTKAHCGNLASAQVYAKVSNVPRRSGERVPDEVGFYRSALDELWEVFGEDRLIYGSNWPVSARIAPYETAFKVVREYFAAKGQEASEKYFWRNSKAAYRWGGVRPG
jgi:L-fuconolactonase